MEEASESPNIPMMPLPPHIASTSMPPQRCPPDVLPLPIVVRDGPTVPALVPPVPPVPPMPLPEHVVVRTLEAALETMRVPLVQQTPIVAPVPLPTTPLVTTEMITSFGTVPLYPVCVPRGG